MGTVKAYEVRLVIGSPGENIGDRDRQLVQIEVGVPTGRLRATEPGTALGGAYFKHRLFLITGPDKDFLANAYAPSAQELVSGASRRVEIPGYTSPNPDNQELVQWSLNFDDSSSEEIERFIGELEAQGCIFARTSG